MSSKSPSRLAGKKGRCARAPLASQGVVAHPLHKLSVALASALSLGAPGAAWAASTVTSSGKLPQTTVITQTDASTIDVNTVRRNNSTTAFNSFHDFQVGQNDTVNLPLPDGAANLVNLVDTRAIVDGTVNSMVGATKGAGRVFFADANGMVVGATGSINVGALSIVTPSQASMDALLSEAATGGGTMTGKLLDGSIDHDAASVSINGRITTTSGVRIQAHALDTSGTIFVAGGATGTGFDTAVNTGGDGQVSIVKDDQGIRLVGETISLANGSQVKATGRDVTLVASAEDSKASGQASAESSVTLNGAISGRNVSVNATSNATADYASLDDAINTLGGTLPAGAVKIGLPPLPIGYVAASSTAAVTLGGTASIIATGDVVLSAATSAKSATSALNNVGQQSVLAAAIYGETRGDTSATIASGASIQAGGNVTVKALHSDELDISAKTSGKDTSVAVTAVIGNVVTDTRASVASGATISGKDVSILAHNSGSYEVSSEVKANEGSSVGANAALLFVDSNASATNNANLGTTQAPLGSLTVLTDSVTAKTSVEAETAVGAEQDSTTPKQVVSSGGADLMPFLEEKLGEKLAQANEETAKQTGEAKQGTDADSGKSFFRGGVGVAVADVSNGAHASIGNGAGVKASGDVAVQARIQDAATTIAATTETESGKDNAATLSASLAFGVGLLNDSASATVGSNADISGLHIGVGSDVSRLWAMPDTSGLDEFSNVPSFLKDLYTDLKGNGKPLATSYANATSKTQDVGLAGAMSFLAIGNDNTAWGGSGAKLNATASTDAAWTHTASLGSDAEGNAIDDVDFGFQHAVGVSAQTLTQTIDIAGNIELLKVNGTSGGADGGSVGAGVNVANYSDNTLAGIGDGVTVTAAGVGVSANDTQQMVVITPSAGRGAGAAGNVIFAMANIDNTTHASIANTASVTANVVDVAAHQGAGIWSIAGAIAQGSSVGVGVGIAINNLTADTQAYIGDNSADATRVDPSMAAAASLPTAGILANTVTVQAATDGRSGAIAISGAQAKGQSQQAGAGSTGGGTGSGTAAPTDGSGGAADGKLAGDASPGFLQTTQAKSDSSTSGFGISTLLGKLPVVGDLVGKAKQQEGSKDSGSADKASEPSMGIGVSGSATVGIGNLDTHAAITGVTIDRRGTTGGSDISVTALNQTDLISASGAGALVTANSQGQGSAGLAGAVAYSFMDNDTMASLSGVIAPHAGDVTVQALSGGSILDLGLGLAYNKNSDDTSASAAGSFSIGTTSNETSASITNSTLTAASSASSLDVTAYDHTNIGAGGGAFAIGGSKGVGASVTWSDIANTDAATISGGTYSGFGDLSVQALTASRIAAAAAAVAASKGSDSLELAGSFTINQVANSVTASVTGATVSNGKGDVTVNASGSKDVKAYDDLLMANGYSTASFVDFSAASVDGSSPTGSAIFAVSGAVGLAGGSAAGMSVAINSIADTYAASIVGGAVSTTGNVAVTASDDTRIVAIAAGIAGGKGEFAGAGSVTANFINDNVSATLGDTGKTTATTVNAGTVKVDANNAATIDTLAGAIGIAPSGSSMGLAVAFDEIGSQTSASIVDAKVTTTGSGTATGCSGDAATVSASACSSGTINAAAVGVAGSDQLALTASLAINDIGLEDTGATGTLGSALRQTFTRAKIDASTLDTSSVGVHAQDSATIHTLAGAIAGSSEAAAGAGFALGNIGNNTTASLTSTQVKATGAVNVDAAATGTIDSLAIGGAVAGDIAVGGSLTANAIGNHTTATVDGLSGLGTAPRATMASLDVTASDAASIDAFAGSLAVGFSGAGIGAASSANAIGNITHATLSNSVLDVTGSTTVDAAATAAIRTVAAAAAGGEGLGISGALTVNTIGNDIAATIQGGSQDSAGNTTKVTASDDAKILSMAGSLGVSAGGGLGAAIAVNDIGTNTTATIDGANWHAKDVTVAATSSNPNSDHSANIQTMAAGVGGGSVGGAASAAVNLVHGTVDASIVGGAHVTAENNVGVIASSRQGIDVFAGSAGIGVDAVGAGLGAVVNYLHDTTSARISGATTQVNALGKNASDKLTVASGQLANPGALDTGNIHDASDYTNPNLAEGTVTVSGLAVNASSTQEVATLGASVAAAFDPLGSAAISAMANANVLGGSTTASITDAQVNQGGNSGAGATQAVDVRASSHAYDASFVAGVAAGVTDAAATGAIGVNAFQRTTQATVQNANITTRGTLNVDAESSQRNVSAVVGLAAALTGGAGTAIVNHFDGQTSALVDRGTLTAGTLDVTANSTTQANLIGGAGAFGGVAVAGSFLLSDSENTTSATVGDKDADTILHIGSDIDVEAHSNVTLGSTMVSGAGGGGAAVAGMASVTVVGNTTTATMERAKVNQTDASGVAGVEVHAGETLDIASNGGSAAISLGGSGVGASANVVMVQSAVGASVLDSALRAVGAVDVAATSTRTLDVTSLSGALGSNVGISGALGLAIIGNGVLNGSASGNDPMGDLNKGGNGTLASMNSIGGSGVADSSQMGNHLSSGDATAVNAATKVSLLDGSGKLLRKADGTQATVANSTVTAGSVAVTANGTTSLTNVVGNIAGGGFLGAGGAVAFNVVDQNIGATVDATSSISTSGALDIEAHANNGTAKVYGSNLSAEAGDYSVAASAYQGAAGFVGLGAGVAISELNNQVSASLDGSAWSVGSLTIKADDTTAVGARAGGLVAGGAAAGVVVSQADKHGSTHAGMGEDAYAISYGATTIGAASSGKVDARANAVAAGLFAAGNGSDANARDRETVSASLGKGAQLGSAGAINLSATSNPDVEASAFGVAVSGGVALGASVATAEDDANVSATLGDNVVLASGATTTVSATHAALSDGGVSAKATGGAGGVLLGANASYAKAVSSGSAMAGTGDNVTLPYGNLIIQAVGLSAQTAGATAGAAGFVGVGAAISEADATSQTSAYLGTSNHSDSARPGAVLVSALGTDINAASATAGSGGVISGNAANATTNDTATTNASISDGSTLYGSGFTLAAQHNTNYAVDVNAVGAGIANASGAFAQTNAHSDVSALVGKNVALYGSGYIDIAAANLFANTGSAPQVQGGGGGVASGAAATNSTTLSGTSTAKVGNDSTLVSGLGAGMAGQLATQYDGLIYTSGPDPFANPGRIRVGAGTQVNDDATVSLDSGGAVAGSGVRNTFTATLANDVGTGDRDKLLTNGAIGIGSYMQSFTNQTALSHTYGGGAQGDARASTTINATQNVGIGQDGLLLGFGQMNITAGIDPSGFIGSVFTADTIGQAYVRGIIAIATGSATTAVHSTATTTVGSGARLLGGADISLGSYKGEATVSAEGAGHGYEIGFIPVTTTSSDARSDGGENLVMSGSATAGIYSDNEVSITSGGLSHAHGAPLLYTFNGAFRPWGDIDQHAAGLGANTDSSGSSGVPVVQGAGQLKTPTGLQQMNGDGDGTSAPAASSGSTGAPPGSASQVDLSVADLLKGTTSSGTVQAYLLGSMFASGGNLTVHAGNITGAGTLTANGSPSVTISNASSAYLVLDKVNVSANGGGAITFTGGANQASDPSLKVNVGSSATAPAVTISNTYTGSMPSSPNNVTQGPAIFIGGDITNLGGVVDITNLSGSVGQFAKVSAQQIKEYVPNGAVAVYLPDSTYYSGADPVASWAAYQINLGDANSAVMYALNAIYNANGQYNGNNGAFNNAIYNQGKGALAFNDGSQGGVSVIAFGTCAPYANGTCGTNPLGGTYGFHDQDLPGLYTLATTKSYATDQTPTDTSSASGLVAQTVAVKAKWIDIDSTITAGRPTDYVITLGADAKAFIDQQAGGSGTVDLPTNLWCGGAAATCVSGLVKYDRGSKSIVIDNVNASGGGFVSLDGGIVSTKATGNIVINDGYGHVTVNNSLGIPVQLADVNTGNNAVGELKITDTYKTWANGSTQTLWYVDTRGVGTKVYNNSNGATDVAHAVEGTAASDGSGFYYDPQAGLRYQWEQQVNVDRDIANLQSTANWGYVDATGTKVSTPQYLLVSSGIVSNPSDTNYFDEKITATTSYGQMNNGYASVLDVYYHGCGKNIGDGCHYGFARTVNQDKDISHNDRGAGVWQYQYLMDAQLLLTSSVKADNRIHINFQGNASGQVQVNSNANVLLGGNIYNPSGSTSIDATAGAGGSILAGTTGAITSNGVSLKATGAIGSTSNPLQLVMTGGSLAADAGAAGININAATALNLDHVTAGNASVGYGDVALNATGNITGGTGTSITGRDITVNSGGSIGTASQALVIAAHGVTNANHGIDHGVVDAHALSDINLRQVGGDLRVGLIQSDGGSVNVAVPDGSIIDAAGTTSGQALSADQLTKVREVLHLTDADDADGSIAAANRKRIEQTADGNYSQYEGLMANGTVVDGAFVLAAGKIDLYRGLASAALGHAASDQETLAYAAGRYTTLDAYFTDLLGANYKAGAKFTTPVADFAYVATDAQVDAMTEFASWKLGWLTSAVNTAAVASDSSASTPPLSFVGSATPNIQGRDVTLSAKQNIG
ncbi:leukotoxin LktA family filamentous adhesin [Luteibacter sp.]|uniref:leukotoxin LktA family filamentous adhesin n=1 Tax=Luteibacter sp. TaxID=1886636 RepID=UPI003F80CEDB